MHMHQGNHGCRCLSQMERSNGRKQETLCIEKPLTRCGEVEEFLENSLQQLNKQPVERGKSLQGSSLHNDLLEKFQPEKKKTTSHNPRNTSGHISKQYSRTATPQFKAPPVHVCWLPTTCVHHARHSVVDGMVAHDPEETASCLRWAHQATCCDQQHWSGVTSAVEHTPFVRNMTEHALEEICWSTPFR